jgi:general nucleoside transport system permease protein
MITMLSGIIGTAALAGGVLALAALGGLMANRVGVLNLGLEGLMAIGGVTAIVTVAAVPNPYLGFAAALAAGAVVGAIFAFTTVVLQANQVLCGLAIAIGGSGLAATIGRSYSGKPSKAVFESIKIPFLSDIPLIGPALFSQNLLIYLAFIFLPIVLYVLYFRTRHGMNLRAVGENPGAADAVGIRVTYLRCSYVILGAAVTASSGAYLTLAFIPAWSDGVTAGRGWISIALIIFAGYHPIGIAVGALIFGCISALSYVGQAQNWLVPSAVLQMLPYVATLAAMIIPKLASERLRVWGNAPAALGVPYYRDQR